MNFSRSWRQNLILLRRYFRRCARRLASSKRLVVLAAGGGVSGGFEGPAPGAGWPGPAAVSVPGKGADGARSGRKSSALG